MSQILKNSVEAKETLKDNGGHQLFPGIQVLEQASKGHSLECSHTKTPSFLHTSQASAKPCSTNLLTLTVGKAKTLDPGPHVRLRAGISQHSPSLEFSMEEERMTRGSEQEISETQTHV